MRRRELLLAAVAAPVAAAAHPLPELHLHVGAGLSITEALVKASAFAGRTVIHVPAGAYPRDMP